VRACSTCARCVKGYVVQYNTRNTTAVALCSSKTDKRQGLGFQSWINATVIMSVMVGLDGQIL
jgi:hypothetical protein